MNIVLLQDNSVWHPDVTTNNPLTNELKKNTISKICLKLPWESHES